MKTNKFLCLILMLAVVLTLASCDLLPFSKKEYKVAFDTDGGSVVDAQTVTEGKTIAAPEDPTKEGYTFIGWFHGDSEWDFDTPVNEDIVLKAKWQKTVVCSHVDRDDDGKCDDCGSDFSDGNETYTITYKDGSKTLSLSPKSYTKDSTGLSLPEAPAKAHYDFIGWYSDSALTSKVDSINVGSGRNLVFYAGYKAVPYRIEYQLDGGVNSEDNSAAYTVEDLPLTLADPTKDGYDFAGWYTDANCTTAFEGVSEDSIGNITLYAKWEKTRPSHSVTYNDHEGNLIATESFYESSDDQPIKEYTAPEGYTFLGWEDADGKLYTSIPAGTSTDLVLTAKIKENAITHSITYYINGEIYAVIAFEEEIGIPELAPANKGGYEFDGWYASADCTGDKVTSVAPGTAEDVEVYGTHTVITYTVKYFDGDIELPFEPTEYQVSDTDIELPVIPAKDGLKIVGWHDVDGNKYTCIPAGSYGDLVLYAKYESAIFYITYHLDGGENSEDNVTEYNYDQIPTLYDPLARDGYKFGGWYTNASFTGKPVEDLSDLANQDVTLYAKWTPYSGDEGDNLTPDVPF